MRTSRVTHPTRTERLIASALVLVVVLALTTLHVRERNGAEAAAIGRIRAVTSAEAMYASMSGGQYETVDCLLQPSCALPGASPFLRFGDAQAERAYRYEFVPGPAAVPTAKRQPSPSPLTRYAYLAVPLIVGGRTLRAFCADDTEQIFVSADGSRPRVGEGRCADRSTPLR